MARIEIDGYIAERAFNRPLLLEAGKAEVISKILFRKLSLGGIETRREIFSEKRPFILTQNGTAVIPIIGTLVHRGSNVLSESGIQSYASLRGKITQAASDPYVKGILLDIDSGGGEVDGNFELAAFIRKVNEEKPVIAIANGSAYSGAYSLGVSAGKFYVTETGGVGSVGVIIQHVDFSESNEMRGIKITNIVAGRRKGELSPDFPLSDSARNTLQNEANRISEIFINHVANMRGISADQVAETEAALIFGEEAVSLKFVDGIKSYEEVLFSLDSGHPIPNNKLISVCKPKSEGLKMLNATEEDVSPEKEETVPEAEEGGSSEGGTQAEETEGGVDAVERSAQIVEACAKFGMAEKSAEFIRSGLSVDQVKEKISTINIIKQACDLAGKPELAQSYLAEGKSLFEIQSDLLSQMAENESKVEISGTPDPKDVSEDFKNHTNVILQDVEKRKMKHSTGGKK